MVRITGVDLPKQKRIEIALTYIYGIGLSRSKEILHQLNIDPNIRCKGLDDLTIIKLRELLDQNYKLEGDLRRFESLNIKRLVEINCFRGRRHRMGLPLRGQRTRTNARTRRGLKRTVAGKKKAPRK
uniref:Small ribosomal subunit protein uS13c n=1 Tax=Bulboplastis apyrenoidosa TaxID=1070855 RepID=A0A1Y9TM87_9RHOD|nr:30S ribosomal protein S13 [Bulboplastis apyrenoidosa]ARO90765.1 30S ribosomal protein S13 [Bulboplastis apyrenoidosa]